MSAFIGEIGLSISQVKVDDKSNEIITFQDTLLVKKSTINSNNLYFENNEKNDSGWYMGNLDDIEKTIDINNYEKLFLYQLLSICTKATSIINLPVGAIVMIKDNEIIRIEASNNKEVYAKDKLSNNNLCL